MVCAFIFIPVSQTSVASSSLLSTTQVVCNVFHYTLSLGTEILEALICSKTPPHLAVQYWSLHGPYITQCSYITLTSLSAYITQDRGQASQGSGHGPELLELREQWDTSLKGLSSLLWSHELDSVILVGPLQLRYSMFL